VFTDTGAFFLKPGSLDSAQVWACGVGKYTALPVLTGGAGVGTVIVEAYKASGPGNFVNISTRAFVGSGEDVVIAGFVVTGDTPVTVLVRAVGPELKQFNIPHVLADPVLVLYKGSTVVGTNDDWGNVDPGALSAAFALTGAFPLSVGSTSASLIATLPPGASYTAVLSGKNPGKKILQVNDRISVEVPTDEAIVEVYVLPTVR